MAEPDHPNASPELSLRGADGDLSPVFIAAAAQAAEGGDAAAALRLAGDLHEADLGDLIEALDPALRAPFIRLVGAAFDYTALTEVDEATRLGLLRELPPRAIAEGLAELDSDDAVYILEDLPEEEKAAILSQLPVSDRAALQRSLDYPEDTAGRRMQTEFVAVPPFWTVGQTIDHLRAHDDLPEEVYEVFVVDPAFRLIGSATLGRLLRAPRSRRMALVVQEMRHPVRAFDDQEDVARIFQRYNLVSAAVVDGGDRLVGVLTIDDMVDVIQAEAEEDMRALAGVGDEEISDTVLTAFRARAVWLVFNLGTAALASTVIGLFDGTIEQMVALAILMPIVASLGGNAATQTMTVGVRALATRDLERRNALRIVRRELTVGALNGATFAVIIGLGAWAWFQNPSLGLVIGAAIIINMISAGLAGILIPLGLDHLGADPAVASSVFVTMVTDVVGFFAFLGLAAWWFGIG